MTAKPILVMMDYRGGERLSRCLASIAESEKYFSRIILSVTATDESPDMQICLEFKKTVLQRAEIICTGRELPTMKHQEFWVDYLQDTGATPENWIYWLAYDDQIRLRGLENFVGDRTEWPLKEDTAYFGPWAMRHETSRQMFSAAEAGPMESWTSFPADGPLRLPVLNWIGEQLRQPTYMQMSGCLCQFQVYLQLRDKRPRKRIPMRIEMAAALSGRQTHVEEFPEPISIIYGREDSDRANYGRDAYRADLHLALLLIRFLFRNPSQFRWMCRIAKYSLRSFLGQRTGLADPILEEWRVRQAAID